LDAISHVGIVDESAPNFQPDITLLIDPKAESAVRQARYFTVISWRQRKRRQS